MSGLDSAHQDRNSREIGKHLFDHLQSLRYDIAANAGHSGDIAARPGEACDKPRRDRIQGRHKYHRDLACSVPRRQHRRRSRGDKNVYSATYQLRCGVGDLRRTLCQAVLDDEVLAFNKAPFAHSLPKAINERCRWWSDT